MLTGGSKVARVAECFLTIARGSDSGASGTFKNSKKVIGLELDIFGETLNFHIGIGNGRAKLADIVPLARTLCSNITDLVVQRARRDGGRVPCDKGCSSCCSRCLVPLSVPEPFDSSRRLMRYRHIVENPSGGPALLLHAMS